jgi:plasmid replication initiation protein
MPKQQQKQVYQQQHQQKQVTHQKMPTSLQQRHMSKQQQMQSVQEGEMELAVFGGLQKTQILRGADFSLYEAKVTR